MPKKFRRIPFIVAAASFPFSQFERCATTCATPMTTGSLRGSLHLHDIVFVRPILVPEKNFWIGKKKLKVKRVRNSSRKVDLSGSGGAKISFIALAVGGLQKVAKMKKRPRGLEKEHRHVFRRKKLATIARLLSNRKQWTMGMLRSRGAT
ncbi:MAG: hypothetical protein GY820_36400 [Gammaproteobacteria bacterium]|nr:hypothetical protein [Gammaproteobacteria bacterium]